MKYVHASVLGAAGAALVGIAVSASAVPLNNSFAAQSYLDTTISGTTVAARPELAGTVVADTLQSFSFLASGATISGEVQNRVVRETGTGTLDFYWRVITDAPVGAALGVDAFRLINFGYSNLSDADFRTDGLGTVDPTTARLFNPSGDPTGAINFLFGGNDVLAGESSAFFFLHTTATAYAQTAQYDLLGGPDQNLSGEFSTYAPAASTVPEPATLGLLSLGMAGIGFMRRRKAT